MAENRRCDRCGQSLPADAPKSACPACILRTGLEPGAQTTAAWVGQEATIDHEPARPGHVLETLARSFGPITEIEPKAHVLQGWDEGVRS